MTNQETTQASAFDELNRADVEGESRQDEGQDESQPNVQTAEFQSFDSDTSVKLKNADGSELNRLQNIQIGLTAELGRAQLPIQDLMAVSEGTVVELDEQIDSLVKLVSQGVVLAAGEVVVVDGNFAIRVVEVYGNK